jgi:hypothetical protein
VARIRWLASVPAGVLAVPGRELTRVLVAARHQWRAGRRPVLAVVAAGLCVAITAGYASPALRPDVIDAGAVRARLPLGVELVRLPLSAFVPTVELPLLAAVLQVLVVVGLAELLVGRLATVTVAIASQALCTLLARVLVQAGGLLGLPIAQAGVLDTGPSVITTALGAWLLLRYRAYWCLGLLAGALLAGAAVQDNLDGREHLAAVLCGLTLPGVGRWGRRLLARMTRQTWPNPRPIRGWQDCREHRHIAARR